MGYNCMTPAQIIKELDPDAGWHLESGVNYFNVIRDQKGLCPIRHVARRIGLAQYIDVRRSAFALGLLLSAFRDMLAASENDMANMYTPDMFLGNAIGMTSESIDLFKTILDLRVQLLKATGLKEAWTEEYERITKDF